MRVESFKDGVIYRGNNPYGESRLANAPQHGAMTGCPIMGALMPRQWGGNARMCTYEVRRNDAKAELAWQGAGVGSDVASVYYEDRALFQINKDLVIPSGVGASDGDVFSLQKTTHEAVLRAIIGCFYTGKLEAGGVFEQYFTPENAPKVTAAAQWTASSGNPLLDIHAVFDAQADHGVDRSKAVVLSRTACNKFMSHPSIIDWAKASQDGSPLSLVVSLPSSGTMQGTGGAGAFADEASWMDKAGTQTVTDNPWFDIVGMFAGIVVLRDRAGLLQADTALFLPQVDSSGRGYRAVFGPVDVGGERVDGQICVAKRGGRSGCRLEASSNFGLMLDDGNPWHAVILDGI